MWKFTLLALCVSSGPALSAEEPDWIPMPPVKNVEAGSALDFSSQGFHDAPAGKYGWVRNVDGHFEFENRPGVKQRFYGVNLCFSANYPERPLADELIMRLKRIGYNSIRIHHYDGICTKVDDGRVVIAFEMMDRLDYLAAKAIENGIYLTTDLYVSRKPTWKDIGEAEFGNGQCPFKALVLCHDGAFRNWCEFARTFLTHVNPYTGRAWGREPALLFMPLVNEGTFAGPWPNLAKVQAFRSAFREWIVSVRASCPEAFPEVDGTDIPDTLDAIGGRESRVYGAFLAYLEGRGFRRMRDFLRRELGVKTLLTNQNCGPHLMPMQVVREELYDLADDHAYVDHPKFIGEKKWSLPIRMVNGGKSQIMSGGCCAIHDLAFTRVLDKPFTVTEWNWSFPGAFRAQGALMTGAAAAVQDWSGLWRFAYAHKEVELREVPNRMEFFNLATDPVMQATDRAALMMYLRGDVETAVRGAAHVVDVKDLPTQKKLKASGTKPPWRELVWRMRVGTCLPGRAGTGAVEVPATVSRQSEVLKLVGDAGVRSVKTDNTSGVFSVSGAKTAGGYATGGAVDCGAVRFDLPDAPAAVWASTLDGETFASSRRILVSHVTDARNTGTILAENDAAVMTAWGKPPVLVRVGSAGIRLLVGSASGVRVWALDGAGRRCADVPVTLSDGVVGFSANVRQPFGATFHYEVEVDR